MQAEGVNIPPEVVESTILTSFAWEARYPGLSEPITFKEYHEAILQAERVVKWAKEIIKK